MNREPRTFEGACVGVLHQRPSQTPDLRTIILQFQPSLTSFVKQPLIVLTEEISFPETKPLVIRRDIRSSFNSWFNRGLHALVVLVCFSYAAYALYNGYIEKNFSPLHIAGLSAALPIGMWVLHGLVAMNLAIRKRGLDAEKNKKLIDRLLREEYRDFHFHLRENDLLSIRLWTAEKPGKEIRVYFRDNDVMVNVKTLLRYGAMESPYHVIKNRQESREILKMFEERTFRQQA
jgi:hypothetical protein